MKGYGVFVNDKLIYKTLFKKKAERYIKQYCTFEIKPEWYSTIEDYERAITYQNSLIIKIQVIELKR